MVHRHLAAPLPGYHTRTPSPTRRAAQAAQEDLCQLCPVDLSLGSWVLGSDFGFGLVFRGGVELRIRIWKSKVGGTMRDRTYFAQKRELGEGTNACLLAKLAGMTTSTTNKRWMDDWTAHWLDRRTNEATNERSDERTTATRTLHASSHAWWYSIPPRLPHPHRQAAGSDCY